MKPTLRTTGGSEIVAVLAFDESSRIVYALLHDKRCTNKHGYWLAELSADELTTDKGTVTAAVRRIARVIVNESTELVKGRSCSRS